MKLWMILVPVTIVNVLGGAAGYKTSKNAIVMGVVPESNPSVPDNERIKNHSRPSHQTVNLYPGIIKRKSIENDHYPMKRMFFPNHSNEEVRILQRKPKIDLKNIVLRPESIIEQFGDKKIKGITDTKTAYDLKNINNKAKHKDFGNETEAKETLNDTDTSEEDIIVTDDSSSSGIVGDNSISKWTEDDGYSTAASIDTESGLNGGHSLNFEGDLGIRVSWIVKGGSNKQEGLNVEKKIPFTSIFLYNEIKLNHLGDMHNRSEQNAFSRLNGGGFGIGSGLSTEVDLNAGDNGLNDVNSLNSKNDVSTANRQYDLNDDDDLRVVDLLSPLALNLKSNAGNNLSFKNDLNTKNQLNSFNDLQSIIDLSNLNTRKSWHDLSGLNRGEKINFSSGLNIADNFNALGDLKSKEYLNYRKSLDKLGNFEVKASDNLNTKGLPDGRSSLNTIGAINLDHFNTPGGFNLGNNVEPLGHLNTKELFNGGTSLNTFDSLNFGVVSNTFNISKNGGSLGGGSSLSGLKIGGNFNALGHLNTKNHLKRENTRSLNNLGGINIKASGNLNTKKLVNNANILGILNPKDGLYSGNNVNHVQFGHSNSGEDFKDFNSLNFGDLYTAGNLALGNLSLKRNIISTPYHSGSLSTLSGSNAGKDFSTIVELNPWQPNGVFSFSGGLDPRISLNRKGNLNSVYRGKAKGSLISADSLDPGNSLIGSKLSGNSLTGLNSSYYLEDLNIGENFNDAGNFDTSDDLKYLGGLSILDLLNKGNGLNDVGILSIANKPSSLKSLSCRCNMKGDSSAQRYLSTPNVMSVDDGLSDKNELRPGGYVHLEGSFSGQGKSNVKVGSNVERRDVVPSESLITEKSCINDDNLPHTKIPIKFSTEDSTTCDQRFHHFSSLP